MVDQLTRFSLPFGPVLDESEFAAALHQADFFVITEKPGCGASFFPSKTVPGLASGTPILSVSDPDSPLGREMRNQDVGPWFPWNRCSEIGDLLGSLDGLEPEFVAWQRNAITRARSFSRGKSLDLIETTLQSILACRVEDEASGVLDAKSATSPI